MDIIVITMEGGEIMAIGAGMARLQLTVSARVVARLERVAEEAGMPKSQYITMLINNAWKEAGHTEGEDVVMGD